MEAKLKIEKVSGPRPTALSHKLFRLDIVYGLFGVPERGSHVGPRGKGLPSKKRPASGAGASSSTCLQPPARGHFRNYLSEHTKYRAFRSRLGKCARGNSLFILSTLRARIGG